MTRKTVRTAVFLLSSAWLFAAESAADRGWKVLTAGTAETNTDKRAKAVNALGLIVKNAKAQEMAEKALNDEKVQVQVAAATALGQMGAKSSVDKLVEAAKHEDSDVLFAAANALYVLGDPRA